MKLATALLLYSIGGFVAGTAFSLPACGVCNVTLGDVIVATPAGKGPSEIAQETFLGAELAAPFLGMFIGIALAYWRYRKPRSLPVDPDDPYRPPG
jgi:hypothetical protein